MDAQITISGRIVEWLSSMGYPVSGMPHELLRGMLVHEARQWQIAPQELAALIQDGSNDRSRETPLPITFLRRELLRTSERFARIHA